MNTNRPTNLLDLLMNSAAISPAMKYLADHDFKPLEGKHVDSFAKIQAEIAAMRPEEVDSVFITVLMKNPSGKPCAYCGKDHEGHVTQYLGAVGSVKTLSAMAEVGLQEVEGRSSPLADLENFIKELERSMGGHEADRG